MERQKFEESWKKAFEDAGLEPSGNVWTNIELDLEKSRGVLLRRRLLFFQLVAAASVIFALGVGVGVFIIGKDSFAPSIQIASNPQKPVEDQHAKEQKAIQPQESVKLDNQTAQSNRNKKPVKKQTSEAVGTEQIVAQKISTVSQYEISEVYSLNELDAEQSNTMRESFALPAVIGQPKIALHLEEKKTDEDPVALMLAKLDAREKEFQKEENRKKDIKSEKLWTSVGVAAGSYTPVNVGTGGSGDQRLFALNSSIANQEAKASGITYSVGANVGTKLSNRWVVQGGVNYLTQTADYTAHNAVVSDETFTSFRPASINELKKLNDESIPSDEKVVATAPYNVNNNVRYMSIPLQAGFILVNKSFGLQLNAGASTDLFLQNTVTAEGADLGKSSSQQGSNSPYRTVNVSGLMGTEVSYRFSKHYRISLNPGVRYPFSSIYRTSVDVKANPLTFDVGLRFRYIFH